MADFNQPEHRNRTFLRDRKIATHPARDPRTRGHATDPIGCSNAGRDLRMPPSSQLEALIGDRRGQRSIRVNSQWRICFRFEQSDAFDVEIVDYHR